VPLFAAQNRASVEIANFWTIPPLAAMPRLDPRSVEAAALRSALRGESHAPIASGGRKAPSRRGLTVVRGIAKTGRYTGVADSPARSGSRSMLSIRIIFAANKESNCHQSGYGLTSDGSPGAILSRIRFRDTQDRASCEYWPCLTLGRPAAPREDSLLTTCPVSGVHLRVWDQDDPNSEPSRQSVCRNRHVETSR
jgi:hypothetical protein